MEVIIRPVKLSDSEDIANYLFTQAKEEDIKKNLQDDIQKMDQGKLLRIVAEIDGKVIGQCDFRRPSSATKQHIIDITGLVVNSQYQGKRVSSKLMEYGFNWAKERGITIATIFVRKGTKAEDIYLHQGFAIYGELKDGIKETWGEEKIYDEIFLAKRLV